MAAPAARLSTLTMTREAITIGFDAGGGFLGRTRCSDITRFRCAGRHFISITHPDYVDHVLHRARLKYVKSNDYEPIRAAAGINLLTDEGDSWGAHRATLNPTFARRRPAPHRAAWPDRTVGAAAATRVRHEDDIIDGHHIRPGTTVMIPIHHIHHDERW
jgi:cytochrome P450